MVGIGMAMLGLGMWSLWARRYGGLAAARSFELASDRDPDLAEAPDLDLAVVDLAVVKDYGGWTEIQKKFFADGAMFDRIRNGS